MKDSGRRWLIAAVGLFVFLLVGWVLLALQLNSALAGPLPFGPGLISRLSANYRADEGERSVALIALSILEPAMQALGLTEDEAAAAHESLELAMSQPVPTATAMDFDGAAPFTPTPTVTNTPLPTNTPPPTAANTRRPPTKTPRPTKTDTEVPAPTETPSGPTATVAPTATVVPTVDDDDDPDLDLSGASWGPADGYTTTDPECSINFTMSGLHVTDPAISSGIDYVGFKYRIPGYVPSLTLGPEFDLDGGGPSGGGWDGIYSGSLMIDIFDDWSGSENEGPDDFHIELWVKTIDFQENEAVVFLGDYFIDDACDD
jgi:hypothetical protein